VASNPKYVLLSFWLGSSLVAHAQESADYALAAHWTCGVTVAGPVRSISAVDDIVLAVDGAGIVQRFDVTDPAQPLLLAPLEMPQPLLGFVGREGAYLYGASETDLYVLDATTLGSWRTFRSRR
jgi:hypothetical protein